MFATLDPASLKFTALLLRLMESFARVVNFIPPAYKVLLVIILILFVVRIFLK